MTSRIMGRSLELSQIERLGIASQAADNWLRKETDSRIGGSTRDRLFTKIGSPLKDPEEPISFVSTTAFKECHLEDRREIAKVLDETRKKSRQKKEPMIVFLTHARDAIIAAAKKQQKSLTTIVDKQIEKGEWVDHLKTIPAAILIHKIVPFLQPKIINSIDNVESATSFVYKRFNGNDAEVFQKTYLDSYVGSKSLAAARFQALSNLTFSCSPFWLLHILGRKFSDQPALCPADQSSLTLVLRQSSEGAYTTFDDYHKKIEKAAEDGPLRPTNFDAPYHVRVILEGLFKEIQKIKADLAFRSTSTDLCAESPTIAEKLPKMIVQSSIAPYLCNHDLGSLKTVNIGFYLTLSTHRGISKGFYLTPSAPLRTHSDFESPLSLTAFFEKYKGAAFNSKKEKEYAKEFFQTFDAMSSDDQRAFRKMLWVAGGHQPKNVDGETFAKGTIAKKSHVAADRTVLSRAFDMINSREKLKELANRFDEEGVGDAEMATIQQDYQKLPIGVRRWVEKVAYIFRTGNGGRLPPSLGGIVLASPAFSPLGAHAKAYALACRVLAEGDFELLPKEARDELVDLVLALRQLNVAHSFHFRATVDAYNDAIKHEKAKNLLIKAIESVENCPGTGEKYMQNAARNTAGIRVPFNPAVFATLVKSLAQVDTPVFR